MQYFFSIDSLITAVFAFIFGIIVILKNRKNIVNQTGALLTFATSLWAFGYWQWLLIYKDLSSALFWTRILTIGSILMPLFFLHWIISLLNLNRDKRKLIIFSYLLTCFTLLFSFSSLLVKNVEPISNFAFWPKAGSLYIFYIFFIYASFIFYGIYLLFVYHKKFIGLKRLQLKYVLIGSVIAYIGGFTNFFLWYDIEIIPIGNVFVVLYLVIFSYSIVKYRLMDIKVILRRSFVYLGSLATIILLAVSIGFVANIYFNKYLTAVYVLVLILSVSIFVPIRNAFYRVANKYFFSSLYDSNKVIANLSDELQSSLDINKVYRVVSKIIFSAFHAKAISIMGFDEKTAEYYILFNSNLQIDHKRRLPGSKDIQKVFIEENKPIVVDEIKNLKYTGEFKEITSLLKSLKAEILIPLNTKDKNIGLIVLSEKESRDMYNDEDLRVLKIVGAQAAIAIENALLYENQKNFNIKLEKEVKRATRDLKKANVQLKKLDEAKSDFISIASHQLRTPLTVIKGYISMILEGNFGKPAEREKEPLARVFESNERLIQLVEDLLNISRIESGRLKFNLTEVDLNKMVESVVGELKFNAEKKNLTLKYKAPAKQISMLKLDNEKVRQVVMNLIDNAIKYTKEGDITVELEQKADKIKFSVADLGMGIRPEDMVNLFKKFSRGTGTSLVHTEGTGLGLYVARMMIEAHHGKIWAESDGEGKGSKFCFELPVK